MSERATTAPLPSSAPPSARNVLFEALAVGVVALVLRIVGLGKGPVYDELYHVLAARSYLTDGSLVIHGAYAYDRVEAFTVLVARLFGLFGESLVVGRIPSVLCGTLVVVVVFLWLRSRGERLGAWLAAMLCALAPDAIELSQWLRFYAAQHLFVVLGVVACHQVVCGPDRMSYPAGRRVLRDVGWGALGALCLGCAYYTQEASLIAIGGVGLFALGAAALGVLRSPLPGKRRAAYLLGGALVLVVTIPLVVLSDFGQGALEKATYADAWAAWSRHEIRYYHWYLVEHYPTLWTLFPLLVLLAVRRQPSVTLMCLSVFGVAFVAHSLIAWKIVRYFSYALPFFFIVCGLGIAEAAPWLAGAVRAGAEALVPGVASGPRRKALAAGALLAVAVFFAAANHAFVATAKILVRGARPELYTVDHLEHPIAWGLAAERLEDMARDVGALVTGQDTKALYFFGRADYVLMRNKLTTQEGEHPEFWSDLIPVVSTPESLARIRDCHVTGLILFERWQTTTGMMIPAVTLDYIRGQTQSVALPEEWGLLAYRWDDGGTGSTPCPPRPVAGIAGP